MVEMAILATYLTSYFLLQVMQVVEMAILATDLASYFHKRQKFLSIADAGEIDWQVRQLQSNNSGL